MLLCLRLQFNAYRVLGISASSSSVQIQNAAAALRWSAVLGTPSSAVDCLGEIVRGEAVIHSALESLSTPRERMQHRLLWFQGQVWPKGTSDETAHDDALQVLIAAYLEEDLSQIVCALREWHAFLAMPEYWEALAAGESQAHFEATANAIEINALRKNAMALAAEPLAVAARDAWARQAQEPFRDYLAALQQLEETGPWAKACRVDLLFPLNQRLANACITLDQQYRSQVVHRSDAADANRLACAAELQYFRRYVELAWKDIASILPESAPEATVARGQTAEELHRIALDHSWTHEYSMAEELAAEAACLAAGTVPEEKILRALAMYLGSRVDRTPKPLAANQPAGNDSFPQKLPLFASDRWRVAAAFVVLAVLLAACLADSDGSSGSSHPAASVALPPPVSSPQPTQSLEPASTEDGTEDVTDPVTLKLRVLLMQIHAEERTAEQIERQLVPLQRAMESARQKVSPGKRAPRAQDQQIPGHAPAETSKSTR